MYQCGEELKLLTSSLLLYLSHLHQSFGAYGNLMPSEGMLAALYTFHIHDIVISDGIYPSNLPCLSTGFQIYFMSAAGYTSQTNKPCSICVRSGFRVFFSFV
ncbi:hypothetical protein HA466_0313460 [Hirschfeldia incana]|nr:hypothetical protein HA466_0313460 [Hirschfeldia incana]